LWLPKYLFLRKKMATNDIFIAMFEMYMYIKISHIRCTTSLNSRTTYVIDISLLSVFSACGSCTTPGSNFVSKSQQLLEGLFVLGNRKLLWMWNKSKQRLLLKDASGSSFTIPIFIPAWRYIFYAISLLPCFSNKYDVLGFVSNIL